LIKSIRPCQADARLAREEEQKIRDREEADARLASLQEQRIKDKEEADARQLH